MLSSCWGCSSVKAFINLRVDLVRRSQTPTRWLLLRGLRCQQNSFVFVRGLYFGCHRLLRFLLRCKVLSAFCVYLAYCMLETIVMPSGVSPCPSFKAFPGEPPWFLGKSSDKRLFSSAWRPFAIESEETDSRFCRRTMTVSYLGCWKQRHHLCSKDKKTSTISP